MPVDRSRLREEILEAQKARTDLLRWKLILFAALGAVAFGIGTNDSPTPLALACIPFVCAYVDLVCYHLWCQIHVIGAFLRTDADEYEQFVNESRQLKNGKVDAFALERYALYCSSIIASVFVTALGIWFVCADKEISSPYILIIVAGITGIVLSFVTWHLFNVRARGLEELEDSKR